LAITFATAADENWVRRIEHNIKATITKYTASGQIKIKSRNQAPKKKQVLNDKLPISSYQATKKKTQKTLHRGNDNRRRRK
jgi:ATP-dependent RNA helicase DeaD